MWKIRSLTHRDNRGHPKYWSKDVGWTWKDFADVYTTAEKEMMVDRPKDSEWEEQLDAYKY